MKRILSKDELEKLPTRRLLAYKKSLPYPRRKYDTGFLDEKQLEKVLVVSVGEKGLYDSDSEEE